MIGGLFDTYADYLASDLWQEKRQFMLVMYPHCYNCGCLATQVHHKTYENICNEKKRDLLTLCDKCHREHHKNAN